jgi:conjugative transfer signal peptidase TraF
MRFRWGTLLTMTAAVNLLALVALRDMPLRIIWNATASVPKGFYALRAADELEVGDLVAILPPEPLASFLDEGGYLPRGLPLIKPVAALPGQWICREGVEVTIDGRIAATARVRDSRGAPLPVWTGCRTVGPDELFLLNTTRTDSLDGRYFGVVPADAVLGRVQPLDGGPASIPLFTRQPQEN